MEGHDLWGLGSTCEARAAKRLGAAEMPEAPGPEARTAQEDSHWQPRLRDPAGVLQVAEAGTCMPAKRQARCQPKGVARFTGEVQQCRRRV